METPIEETFSFESMRILIDTDRLHSIEDELILSIEDVGYKIMIKEASCVIAPQIKISTSSSMKIRDSNVEEHQGAVMATNEDVASSDQPMEVRLEDDIVQEVVKETQLLAVEPVNVRACEDQVDNANDSTKTKMACFSQNSCSEEILKISQHLEN